MNNLFLFAGILLFVCSMTDGIGHQNKGAMKGKNIKETVLKQKGIPMKNVNGTVLKQKGIPMKNVNGTVLKQKGIPMKNVNGTVLKQKGIPMKNVNGTVLKQKAIRMKECSNIPLECYECFCGGKNVSGRDKSPSLQGTKRVKRADPNWSRLCARCQQSYVHWTTYCEGCSYFVQNENLYNTCAHCTSIATGQDFEGNPACADHVGRGNRQDAVEHENESARECAYCKNRATGRDRDGDPACSNHYASGRGGHAGGESSSRRECCYTNCTNRVTGVDGDGDPVCANHSGTAATAHECAYCTNTATGTDLDGDPACSDHKYSQGNRNRASASCYVCGRATNDYNYNGHPVCPSHNF